MTRVRYVAASVCSLAFLWLPPAHAADSTSTAAHGRFIGVTLGLGIQAHAAADLVDYINRIAIPPYNNRLSEFTTVPELYIAPEVQVSDDWSVGIDYGYLVRSYTVVGSGVGTSQFDYVVHVPVAVVHYLIPGDGYWVKLGGGIGYQFAELSQRLYGAIASTDFRARGVGVKLEAVADTKFDDHLYGSIQLDLRWVGGGSFESGSGTVATVAGTTAKLNFFAATLRFGVLILV